MADKEAAAQQPVISIRISEALRMRLETLKTLMLVRTGQAFSTSEAAKLLLESAKEERLELVNLISDPTPALVQIRRKAESRLLLSKAEWTLVAYYCLQGSEMWADSAQTEILYESLAGMLEAFQAVYELRRKRDKTPLDAFFVAHLPADRKIEAKEPEEIDGEDVRRIVSRTLAMLKNPMAERERPLFIARNLYFLLDELEFPNVEKLNEALRPYWAILWRVCARGHYFLHLEPIREPESPGGKLDWAARPPMPPSFEEGGYRLGFSRGPGVDLCVLLNFPGKYRIQYPVSGYPKISEFRTILQRLDATRELIFWEGRYFLAFTGSDETDVIGVNFRARDNGISFNFHGDDWKSIRNLFRRAWQAPEVRRLWDALALEYGEL